MPKPEKERAFKEPSVSGSRKSKQQKNEEAKKRAALRELERQLQELEQEIARMEEDLQHPEEAFRGDYQQMERHCQTLEEKKLLLEEIPDQWLELSE